ncbi:hypothetical protein SP99_04594 [Enterobacter sp. BIDMC92]|uniref:DUF1471 domain-containing protein n=1 Tax=Enterobacter sp. BIDMC92 TaxID=1594172 RepID=UPI00065810ED|nr:DUF1471 domain-containing protein [Enterobacter sp. BIDMC92]KLW85432.1 hypothetical protein SP99_04594 [Enterobacter sp. BIDMC92]
MNKITFSLFTGLLLGSSALHAAQMITEEQVKHYKLSKIGSFAVEPNGFQMPSDLQDAVSKRVDEKGGKYYVITSVKETEGGLSGTVTAYK